MNQSQLMAAKESEEGYPGTPGALALAIERMPKRVPRLAPREPVGRDEQYRRARERGMRNGMRLGSIPHRVMSALKRAGRGLKASELHALLGTESSKPINVALNKYLQMGLVSAAGRPHERTYVVTELGLKELKCARR